MITDKWEPLSLSVSQYITIRKDEDFMVELIPNNSSMPLHSAINSAVVNLCNKAYYDCQFKSFSSYNLITWSHIILWNSKLLSDRVHQSLSLKLFINFSIVAIIM